MPIITINKSDNTPSVNREFNLGNISPASPAEFEGDTLAGSYVDTSVNFSGATLYLASDSKWYKAQANAIATCRGMLAISIDGTTGSNRTLFLKGLIAHTNFNFSGNVGDPIYMREDWAGAIDMSIPPSGFVRIMGYKTNTDEMYFDPQKTFIELAGGG